MSDHNCDLFIKYLCAKKQKKRKLGHTKQSHVYRDNHRVAMTDGLHVLCKLGVCTCDVKRTYAGRTKGAFGFQTKIFNHIRLKLFCSLCKCCGYEIPLVVHMVQQQP